MIVEEIFTQFLAHDYLTYVNLTELEKYCLEKKTHKGNNKSNLGGFQSIDLNRNEETSEELLKLISAIDDSATKLANYMGIKYNVYANNYWVNVNGKNSFNSQHTHPGSVLSAVFYVKVPENSGDIVFRNPNSITQNSYFNHWHLLDKIDSTIVSAGQIRIKPKNSMLLMFPSWLEHYVDANRSEEDRISIAFNTGLTI